MTGSHIWVLHHGTNHLGTSPQLKIAKLLLTAVSATAAALCPQRASRDPPPASLPFPQAGAFRRRAKWVEFDGRNKAMQQAMERLAERKEEVQRLEAAQEQDTKPIRCAWPRVCMSWLW